jgi:hypothetical protein
MKKMSFALAGATLLALAGFGVLPARAADKVLMGHTVACDSAQEVKSFVGGKSDEQAKAALNRVNRRYGKDACSVETLVFAPEKTAGDVVTPAGLVEIMKVEVLGVVDGSHLKELAQPITQYVPAIAQGGLEV